MTHDALETLVRAHQAEIYRYLRYLGADHALGEDLVQETFLAAFRSRTEPDMADERGRCAWLRVIARNLFMNHWRRQKRNPVRASSDALEQAEATWVQTFLHGNDGFDTVEALRQCLERISGKQRQVLDWFYTQGLSRAETAAAAAMSENGVKSLLQRVRAQLGDCVKRRLNLGGTP